MGVHLGFSFKLWMREPSSLMEVYLGLDTLGFTCYFTLMCMYLLYPIFDLYVCLILVYPIKFAFLIYSTQDSYWYLILQSASISVMQDWLPVLTIDIRTSSSQHLEARMSIISWSLSSPFVCVYINIYLWLIIFIWDMHRHNQFIVCFLSPW